MLRLCAHSCQPALKRATLPLEGRAWHLPAELLAGTNPGNACKLCVPIFILTHFEKTDD